MSSYLHLIHIFIPFVLVFHYFSPSFYSGCVYLSTLLDFPTQIPVRTLKLGWIVMAEKHFKKRSHFDKFLIKLGYTSLVSGAARIVWMRLSYKEVNQFITFFKQCYFPRFMFFMSSCPPHPQNNSRLPLIDFILSNKTTQRYLNS